MSNFTDFSKNPKKNDQIFEVFQKIPVFRAKFLILKVFVPKNADLRAYQSHKILIFKVLTRIRYESL